MKQKAIFLFFCTVFVAGKIYSQNIGQKPPQLLLNSFNNIPVKKIFSLANTANFIAPDKTYLPSNYYVTGLGFFCRQEIKLEKITKFPFKFRLGSVAECDHIEGKDLHY